MANFDPDKGDLVTHINAQLNYELQRCLRPHRRFGVTNAPRSFGEKVVSLEAYRRNMERREMAMAA